MASEVKEEHNSTADVKKDENIDEKPQDIDNSDKDDVTDSLKNESKEDSGKEESDENDDDEDEEVALLDRPVEVTGCRARKKVERLEISFAAPKEKQDFPEGKGKKLGECPRIEVQIQKMKVPDLKPLHRILFNRIGSANEIKKNIRKFCGFPFENDSSEFNRKKASLDKLTLSVLKQACLILDLERGGTKEEIVTRILTFLLNPEDSGKKVPSKKKPSKDKKKSASKKGKSDKKVKSEKDGNSEDDADENADDDSTGGEASMGGTDEENEGADEEAVSDEEPKKKSKEIKSSKGKSKVDKSKKDEKKAKGTKRKIDEDSSDDSEDGKQVKKANKMPSDEEISKLVKQILEAADLQEITMKKVIKQVSDAYPDFDLSHKKAFIKSTIKSVIS